MDFVFLILSVAIILICFYTIILPFFKTKGELAKAQEEKQAPLTLEAIYAAVNELEMDFLMKKITEEDFNNLKEQYQLLAIEIMENEKKQMGGKSQSNRDNEIEREILKEIQEIRTKKGGK